MFCIHIQTYCILLIIGLHGLRLFFIYFLFVTVNNFTDLLNLIGWYRISFLSIAKLISISEYNDCINCCIISKKLSLKNNVLDMFFITLRVIFISFPKTIIFFLRIWYVNVFQKISERRHFPALRDKTTILF